jgi:hypothetical protein
MCHDSGGCRHGRRRKNSPTQGVGRRGHLGRGYPSQLLVDHIVWLDRHAEKPTPDLPDPRARRVATSKT